MSEQTNQTDAFTEPAFLGDMRIYDIGATTLADCYSRGVFSQRPAEEYKNKKPDLLIVSNDNRIVLYLESKLNSALSTQRHMSAAYDQEFDAARNVGSAIFALRDSTHTYWYNPATGNEILDEAGEPLRFHLSPVEHAGESERMIHRIMSSISPKNDRLLKNEEQNPTDLARRVHQLLFTWKSVSPSTALYTFVEIFLFKYLSDLGILRGMDSFDSLMSLYKDNSDLKVLMQYKQGPRQTIVKLFPANNANDAVAATTVVNGSVFHEDVGDAETFHGILDLFVDYEKRNGKFINISPDFKSHLFETFLKQEDDKKRMGQFFTPLKIVKNMVRTVDIREGMKICDPACGVGKFPLEAIAGHINEFYKYDEAEEKVTSTISITGYDKYSEDNGDKTIILAKANALIYFSEFLSEHPNMECARSLANDVLNTSFMLEKDSLGTLERLDEDKYDVILANPPYLVNGSKDMRDKANLHAIVRKRTGDGWKDAVKGGEKYKWGGVGLEALFLEWIIRALKPGGHASIVIPDGILRNANNASLRDSLVGQCIIQSVISLPVNAFFSTPKKTYILNVRKKEPLPGGTLPRQTSRVFAYICSSIGETLDVYRFNDPDNDDLSSAVNSYNIYRRFMETGQGNAVIDQYVPASARLKLIPAQDYLDGSWIVEDHWTEQEKIALGLRNSKENLTPEKFSELLQETISVMDDYARELTCME